MPILNEEIRHPMILATLLSFLAILVGFSTSAQASESTHTGENWSDAKMAAYNHDPIKAGRAALYAERRWPKQFAGYWVERGQVESRWGRVRVFVFAFTRDPEPKVTFLRKRFRFNDSRYRPVTRSNTIKLLRRTMNRVNRDADRVLRGNLELPDGRRHLFAALYVDDRSNSVRIERPWTGLAFRRWLRQRYDGLVTLRKGDFPSFG